MSSAAIVIETYRVKMYPTMPYLDMTPQYEKLPVSGQTVEAQVNPKQSDKTIT